MLRKLLIAFAAALLLQPAGADARGGHRSSHNTRSSSSHSHSSSTRSSTPHHSRSHGPRSTTHHSRSHRTTKRDPAQRHAFMRDKPCPVTGRASGGCPGYVVDHKIPLKRGGADRPWNMQWQTVAEAKAKDKVE